MIKFLKNLFNIDNKESTKLESVTYPNEYGFDGIISIGIDYSIIFRKGLKEELKKVYKKLPNNELMYLIDDRKFLYKNREGIFYELKFEEVDINEL